MTASRYHRAVLDNASGVTPAPGDRGVARGVFAILFFTYAYFFGGCGANQNATFDQTRALVEHGRFSIDEYAANTSDISTAGGHVYPNKPPGLSLVAALPYALLHVAEAGVHAPPLLLATVNLYLSTVAVCGLSGALAGVLLFRLARRLGCSQLQAAALALAGGLGTPMLPYATLLFAHVPTAALTLLSFAFVSGIVPRRPALAGAAIGLAGTMVFPCIVIALIFATLLAITSDRKMRAVLAYAAGGAPFALALLGYQWLVFGSPFRTSLAQMNPGYVTRGAWLGILQRPDASALWGITFSPYRGLFFLSPILLLAFFAAWTNRRGAGRRAVVIGICATALFLALANAGFNGWHGGHGIGPRYLVTIVPLLMTAIALLGGTRPVTNLLRISFLALGAISIFFNLAATAVDPQAPQPVRNPLLHYEIPALFLGHIPTNAPGVPAIVQTWFTGHTSINRTAVDEVIAFRRHPPLSQPGQWGSFNLGELLFGPGSAWSLLPFLLIAGGGTAWLLIKAGREQLRSQPVCHSVT